MFVLGHLADACVSEMVVLTGSIYLHNIGSSRRATALLPSFELSQSLLIVSLSKGTKLHSHILKLGGRVTCTV